MLGLRWPGKISDKLAIFYDILVYHRLSYFFCPLPFVRISVLCDRIMAPVIWSSRS